AAARQNRGGLCNPCGSYTAESRQQVGPGEIASPRFRGDRIPQLWLALHSFVPASRAPPSLRTFESASWRSFVAVRRRISALYAVVKGVSMPDAIAFTRYVMPSLPSSALLTLAIACSASCAAAGLATFPAELKSV